MFLRFVVKIYLRMIFGKPRAPTNFNFRFGCSGYKMASTVAYNRLYEAHSKQLQIRPNIVNDGYGSGLTRIFLPILEKGLEYFVSSIKKKEGVWSV